MKQTSSALTFLLAQYRAIFKRAYIKGIASAVILTAGLAAGQAQAVSSADPFYSSTDGTTFTPNTTFGNTMTQAKIVAGDYDDGTSVDHKNGIVSGAGLTIGAESLGGDLDNLSGSGNAYGGYVELGEDSTLDAKAEGNTLTITSGATINTEAAANANLVGGWAKTNGAGKATAKGNHLIIHAQSGSTVNLNSINTLIGGVAAGNNGALAEGNEYIFSGNASARNDLTNVSGGHRGAMVFVGDGSHSGASGNFEAIGNTLKMSNFAVSGDAVGTGPKTFRGGDIYVYNVEDDNTIEVIRAQGNTVNLDTFTLGSGSFNTGHDVANIAANYVENKVGYVASVEANGSSGTGVFLNEGTLHHATVFGGMAKNVSGGNASASNNLVSITNTDFLRTTSGSTTGFYHQH